MATTTRTNEELVQHAFDALNERDRDAFTECHAEDAVLHVGGEDVRGIDAIADAEFAYFDAFPDLAMAVEAVLAEGDTVAARWTLTGTHDGVFKGIEPTGEAFEFSAMGMFRIEDGEAAEVWLEADELRLLRQLGAVEPPTG